MEYFFNNYRQRDLQLFEIGDCLESTKHKKQRDTIGEALAVHVHEQSREINCIIETTQNERIVWLHGRFHSEKLREHILIDTQQTLFFRVYMEFGMLEVEERFNAVQFEVYHMERSREMTQQSNFFACMHHIRWWADPKLSRSRERAKEQREEWYCRWIRMGWTHSWHDDNLNAVHSRIVLWYDVSSLARSVCMCNISIWSSSGS